MAGKDDVEYERSSQKVDAIVSRVPFFYGWMMLPIVIVTQVATSPGQTFGVSVFNPYIRQALSLSHSEISGAYMLGTLLASIPMIYVGALMDRYGLRRVLTAVVVLFGFACVGISQALGLISVFFSFLFLRMLGQGAMELLGNNALAMWFNRRLGFAAGIMSLGAGFAMGLVPTLNLWLIQGFGWRLAYPILGAGVGVVMLPLLAIFFRNRPEDVGQVPDGSLLGVNNEAEDKGNEVNFTLSQAVRTRAYWIMAVAAALPSMIVTGIHFHAVQIFLDCGLSEADAAMMFTISAAFGVAFTLGGGILADRVPLNLLLSCSTAGLAGGVVILLNVSTVFSSQVFAAVLGMGQGLLSAVGATIWVRYYGREHLGKIRGALATVAVAASSSGPFLMGAAHDYFGSYQEVFWFFVMITTPMVFVGFFATPPTCQKKAI